MCYVSLFNLGVKRFDSYTQGLHGEAAGTFEYFLGVQECVALFPTECNKCKGLQREAAGTFEYFLGVQECVALFPGGAEEKRT